MDDDEKRWIATGGAIRENRQGFVLKPDRLLVRAGGEWCRRSGEPPADGSDDGGSHDDVCALVQTLREQGAHSGEAGAAPRCWRCLEVSRRPHLEGRSRRRTMRSRSPPSLALKSSRVLRCLRSLSHHENPSATSHNNFRQSGRQPSRFAICRSTGIGQNSVPSRAIRSPGPAPGGPGAPCRLTAGSLRADNWTR